MTRGVKGDLTPEEIAVRDLEWIQERAGWELTMKLELQSELQVIPWLRGLARTANSLARHYERRAGIPAKTGRRPNG